MNNIRILSALVGLAGAIGNNGKTENTDAIVREALFAEDSDELVNRIIAEKYVISPNCATCQTPCGNTSDYDMQQFFRATPYDQKCRLDTLGAVKEYIGRLHEAGITELPDIVYKAISYFGYNLEAESYIKLTEEINRC